ncbi:presenilin-like protein At1g08700 [Andrographis paniculata]|uniref:presenilin-like protein At1g08700 n=1 Tax=Andrographis paniculata TaxID=175694 RepID=UPI0021E740B9|nr:presenilin-like protein At1g08700 [Andrographis paniculata]
MESGSILESIGQEIIGVMSPVSICMLLVVLLVYTVYNPASSSAAATTIRTAANLVYLESPSDSTAQKLEGAILNAVVFVVIITLVTFLLVLLYYYRFTNFLIYYTRFSVFMIFSAMGSSILISIIQRFSIPVDVVTFYVLLFNFTILGTISVFSSGIPIIVKQSNMVALGIIVAAWFSRLPEWTTWIVLVALALYDLAAVLAPGGPLKMLVELASSRDEELPALVYESRPNVGRNSGSRASSLGLLVSAGLGMSGDNNSGSVELQELLRNVDRRNGIEIRGRNEHLMISVENDVRISGDDIEEVKEDDDLGETSPLMGDGNSIDRVVGPSESSNYRGNGDSNLLENNRSVNRVSRGNEREGVEMEEGNLRGIKLGMGDFIFYSVLVGRAAMYDLMTVYACYLAIICGLGCTLILLAVCRHALPALPISITLGIIFYFLTRLLMEPFVVGASTNLMMF